MKRNQNEALFLWFFISSEHQSESGWLTSLFCVVLMESSIPTYAGYIAHTWGSKNWKGVYFLLN